MEHKKGECRTSEVICQINPRRIKPAPERKENIPSKGQIVSVPVAGSSADAPKTDPVFAGVDDEGVEFVVEDAGDGEELGVGVGVASTTGAKVGVGDGTGEVVGAGIGVGVDEGAGVGEDDGVGDGVGIGIE